VTEPDPLVPAPEPEIESGPSTGLRLRIWLACLGGVLAMGLGIWWVAGTQLGPGADPVQQFGWLVGIAGGGLVMAAGFALWLDRGIVGQARGVLRGLSSDRVQELRGLPAASGWGELSALGEWAQILITRQRLTHRAVADLEQLENALARITARLEHSRSTERWESMPAELGPAEALARELNVSFARAAEISDQNLEASRRVHSELLVANDDARESAEMAERGFVEATALLTTVRELQRLGSELRAALADLETSPGSVANEERFQAYRAVVAGALEELVGAANSSVSHLGEAMRRVQEISSQVQLVSNRATLVALHAVTLEARLPREQRGGDELSRELRQLTADIREASQRADELAEEVQLQTQAAGERMGSLRESVAPQLEPPVSLAAEAARTPLPEPAARLLERVREMIQDATQKGERLSAAGERASRAADRLLRRLEDEAREVEGLMVRLAPTTEPADATSAESDRAARLRLLADESDAIASGAEPEAGSIDASTSSGEDDESTGPEAREDRP
jgi:hypothetical protein